MSVDQTTTVLQLASLDLSSSDLHYMRAARIRWYVSIAGSSSIG
jgi:hypothetical protein